MVELPRGGSVVVTGGAGYVGAAVAHALERAGARVTVIDNLVQGHRRAVAGLELVEADVRDQAALERSLRASRATAVCHLAALADIPGSFARPDEYQAVNVGGTLSLLAAMRAAGVTALVYASTCAIYAAPPDGRALAEGDPEAPESPYASTKQAAEAAVLAAAGRGEVRALSLRFFNAAGADRAAGVGEMHHPETHAIPRLIRWARGGPPFVVFGGDYPTPDGTCIRDYVHVVDLADAHLRALQALLGPAPPTGVVNLGSGVGTSVHELVEAVFRRLHAPGRPAVGARRSGDPPVLLASVERARAQLGWAPARRLGEILDDAIWWDGINSG